MSDDKENKGKLRIINPLTSELSYSCNSNPYRWRQCRTRQWLRSRLLLSRRTNLVQPGWSGVSGGPLLPRGITWPNPVWERNVPGQHETAFLWPVSGRILLRSNWMWVCISLFCAELFFWVNHHLILFTFFLKGTMHFNTPIMLGFRIGRGAVRSCKLCLCPSRGGGEAGSYWAVLRKAHIKL